MVDGVLGRRVDGVVSIGVYFFYHDRTWDRVPSGSPRTTITRGRRTLPPPQIFVRFRLCDRYACSEAEASQNYYRIRI